MIVILLGILAFYLALFLAGAYLKILWWTCRHGGYLAAAALGGFLAHHWHLPRLVIAGSAVACALAYGCLLRAVGSVADSVRGEQPGLGFALRSVEFVLVGFTPFLIGAGFALHIPATMLTATERHVVIGFSGLLLAILVFYQHERVAGSAER